MQDHPSRRKETSRAIRERCQTPLLKDSWRSGRAPGSRTKHRSSGSLEDFTEDEARHTGADGAAKETRKSLKGDGGKAQGRARRGPGEATDDNLFVCPY